MPSFACVLLIDRRGRLLLQERDEFAPIDPERWGMCGGHLEEGESPADGARRELAEETGLDLPASALRAWRTFAVFHEHYGTVDDVHVFVGGVDLDDADIECHEGRRIVFVDPAELPGLRLTHSAQRAVPALLADAVYPTLSGDLLG